MLFTVAADAAHNQLLWPESCELTPPNDVTAKYGIRAVSGAAIDCVKCDATDAPLRGFDSDVLASLPTLRDKTQVPYPSRRINVSCIHALSSTMAPVASAPILTVNHYYAAACLRRAADLWSVW